MLTLYYYPANASAAPHMVLEEIGISYRLERISRDDDVHKQPEYLALNPMGRIPVLIDHEQAIFESAAIVLHLVDKYPAAGLAPAIGTIERASFYQWLIFLTNSLQEELMISKYPERLAGDDEQAALIVSIGAEKRANAYFQIIEDHLSQRGPYFLGSVFSAVDLYFVMLGRWARTINTPPRSYPSISHLLDLVVARQSVRKAFRDEGITDDIV